MSRWRKPQCKSGKAAFRTQGEARRAIDRIVKDNAQAVAPTEHAPHRAYKCDCGAWHLTKSPERVKVTA
jgi:hypothetical protein